EIARIGIDQDRARSFPAGIFDNVAQVLLGNVCPRIGRIREKPTVNWSQVCVGSRLNGLHATGQQYADSQRRQGGSSTIFTMSHVIHASYKPRCLLMTKRPVRFSAFRVKQRGAGVRSLLLMI